MRQTCIGRTRKRRDVKPLVDARARKFDSIDNGLSLAVRNIPQAFRQKRRAAGSCERGRLNIRAHIRIEYIAPRCDLESGRHLRHRMPAFDAKRGAMAMSIQSTGLFDWEAAPLVVKPKTAWKMLACSNTRGYELIAAGELELISGRPLAQDHRRINPPLHRTAARACRQSDERYRASPTRPAAQNYTCRRSTCTMNPKMPRPAAPGRAHRASKFERAWRHFRSRD